MLVDGHVALYRTDPADLTLFQRLWSDPADVRKVTAVKACAQLLTERDRLYWYPPLAELRDRNAAAVRALLSSQAEVVLGIKPVSRRPRPSGDNSSASVDLLVNIIDLYGLEPVAVSEASENQLDGLREVLSTLCPLLVVPSPEIVRSAAVRTAVTLIGSFIDNLAETEESIVPRDQVGSSMYVIVRPV